MSSRLLTRLKSPHGRKLQDDSRRTGTGAADEPLHRRNRLSTLPRSSAGSARGDTSEEPNADRSTGTKATGRRDRRGRDGCEDSDGRDFRKIPAKIRSRQIRESRRESPRPETNTKRTIRGRKKSGFKALGLIPMATTENPEERIQEALASEVIPHLYANGFSNTMSNADVALVFEHNQKPIATINMSYTLTKSLASKLSRLITILEQGTEHEMLTTDDVAEKMQAHLAKED